MDTNLIRRFYRTPRGFGVPLPFTPSIEEAALPGNVYVIEDQAGVLALATYDERTRTAALFARFEGWWNNQGQQIGAWSMWQPMTREHFFGAEGPVRAALTAFQLDEDALRPAWEGGKLEPDGREMDF